jgi:putative membrane protein
MLHFLNSIGAFALHLAVGIGLFAVFVAAYQRTTPHNELELIRNGNTAAAIGLAGALIGFAIVQSRMIAYSDGIAETVLWALIGLSVQVAGHWALSRFMPRIYAAIEDGEVASGITKAAVAIALGLINAASMTP